MTILDAAREGMDPDIRPQDDLFGHVNGRWLTEYPIPADRATDGGATDAANGTRLCQRHNLVKELDGWHVRVQSTGLDGTRAHGIRLTTPTGRTHDATAPPIHGHGWAHPEPDDWLHDDHPPDAADAAEQWWPDDDAYWAA